MNAPLLRCVALEVGHRHRPLLPPLDVTVERGEFWVVIGRNGSGKTTWLKTAVGLIPPVRGRIERGANLKASYVPQRSHFDELYPMRARDVVRMGIDRGRSFMRPTLSEPPEVEGALAEAEATQLADRKFRSLSEGEKQRVLFARLIASQSQIAFLDEPTPAMDLVAERATFKLLDTLRHRHRMTIVVVSHSLGVVREFADHALLVDRDTQTAVVGTPDEVFEHETFRVRYGDGSELDHA